MIFGDEGSAGGGEKGHLRRTCLFSLSVSFVCFVKIYSGMTVGGS